MYLNPEKSGLSHILADDGNHVLCNGKWPRAVSFGWEAAKNPSKNICSRCKMIRKSREEIVGLSKRERRELEKLIAWNGSVPNRVIVIRGGSLVEIIVED